MPPKKSFRLKCLRCGWKWWSRCRYVEQLPDHVEQCRSGLTDEDVLQRLLDGTLVVSRVGVQSYNLQRWSGWITLKVEYRSSNGSPEYRFARSVPVARRRRSHCIGWCGWQMKREFHRQAMMCITGGMMCCIQIGSAICCWCLLLSIDRVK